jgi:phosphatidylglycerophosphate synthase
MSDDLEKQPDLKNLNGLSLAVPTLLSISRVFGSFLACYIFTFGLNTMSSTYCGLGILVGFLSFFTDALDGFAARSLNVSSKAGKYLDLFCDSLSFWMILLFLGNYNVVPLPFIYAYMALDLGITQTKLGFDLSGREDPKTFLEKGFWARLDLVKFLALLLTTSTSMLPQAYLKTGILMQDTGVYLGLGFLCYTAVLLVLRLNLLIRSN